MRIKIATSIYLILNAISAIYVGINAKNAIEAFGIQILIGLGLGIIFYAYNNKYLKILNN